MDNADCLFAGAFWSKRWRSSLLRTLEVSACSGRSPKHCSPPSFSLHLRRSRCLLHPFLELPGGPRKPPDLSPEPVPTRFRRGPPCVVGSDNDGAAPSCRPFATLGGPSEP